jgi:hypothetical protein
MSEPGKLEIAVGCVYQNDDGEQRLVVSINRSNANHVAVWRTPDSDLPLGAKAQGSATVAIFQRWAIRSRNATKEDWNAFSQVEERRSWRKRDRQAIRRIKARMATQKA